MNNGLECPYCRSAKIKRNGYTVKGFQRFYCYICGKYWQDRYVRKDTDLFEEQKQLVLWAKQHPRFCPYLMSAMPAGPHLAGEAYHLLFAYPKLSCHGLWIRLARPVAMPLTNTWLETIAEVGYAVKIVSNCQDAVTLIESYMSNILD
jgi:InsA-like protein